ncbi:hypothetical protein BURCENBC7_AP7128 [Burkholderia cenocepacia BC7]|nr:hypothetical protein BURCENK562V_C1227 [Burkholderia cenocepacia K56-2Valvano]ERI29674.1 hypothetical protein BURCENBC7_AP7128 [Burkholderia cenocepacia BC7]
MLGFVRAVSACRHVTALTDTTRRFVRCPATIAGVARHCRLFRPRIAAAH